MSESLKTVLNEWRPINGESGEPAQWTLHATRAREIAKTFARDGYWQLCEDTVFAALNDIHTECEDRIKALEAENARLLDLVQKKPATAYLEAVQRSADERLTHLKHAERTARARADEAERQLARARETLKWYARCDIAAKAVADGSSCQLEHDDGARARAAIQDIAAAKGEK